MVDSGNSVRLMLTWDARIVGFAEVSRDLLTADGVVDIVFKPELTGDVLPSASKRSWAETLAEYVRVHGQPWNEMTRFAVRIEDVAKR
jgi:hypothetical protein